MRRRRRIYKGKRSYRRGAKYGKIKNSSSLKRYASQRGGIRL